MRPLTLALPLLLLAGSLLVTLGNPTLAATAETDFPMEEVVVVASKIERPLWRVAAQVTTLHKDELDAQMVRDLGDIARYQPAIEADFAGTRFGSTGLAIRGIGGNRVAMEFDGVPLPRHFEIGEFANNSRHAIDPAIIERIEILRGPASALYGSDAIGGVVAISSIEPNDLVRPGDNHYLGAGGGYASVDDSVLGHITYGQV
ncbi:MAG: TonB-dependent receptor plug domain-containing protein, partial [Pseudomonadales bacterium]